MPGFRRPGAAPHPARRRLRRIAGAAAVTVTLCVALGGCAKFDAALGKREAVVQFKSGTTTAARLKVRAACSHVNQVKPEALPTNHLLSSELYDVRYLVSNATDAELAELQTCLQRFPSVTGIFFNTPAADGG